MSLTRRLGTALAALAIAVPVAATATTAEATPAKNPVVLFPAYHFTKLEVTVNNQQVAPQCPASGVFEDWYGNQNPNATFGQVCRDTLLTLRYDGTKPNMADRFSDQPGVDVNIKDFGKTSSAPYYNDMYNALEAAGWAKDVNIRVAGYDARLTPDMDNFLDRTKALIEDTYNDNGGQRVNLVGHSTGPIYAQYLLTHTTQAWKSKYINGFTSIAGNFPGQGLLYAGLFSGINIHDLNFPQTAENAASSSKMLISHPSSYINAAAPGVFGNSEVVIADASTGKQYTPNDAHELMTAPGMPSYAAEVADYYLGFVKFLDAAHYPNVDVHAEIASGLDTLVGITLPTLATGHPFDSNLPMFTTDGDGNQEKTTNESVKAWANMSCHKFDLTNTPGVHHLNLSSNAALLQRLVDHADDIPLVCA
ncbi:hypothetical protein ABZV60_32750 [Streptomyces sp. NPDC004787]|uniref:lipase/acyltransferase domain-containing protein n=1 Tax=Streptomyces sp. NPDC004787 TaxID=3154291 RepID=UPI0033B6DD7D